jgi:DNA repair exonuclease SbcCD ATPase subunit
VKQDVRPPTTATVHVENVGGIDETTVELSAGVTALVGQNATNRTSLLQAIAGALGSDHVTLKGDAEAGQVTLALGDEEYTRQLERRGGSVSIDGDPYLNDPELLDLYGVLLRDNEVRRAVRGGADLRSLIMRPVDTEEIQRRISDLVDERGEIDQELDRLDSLEDELPRLEAERQRLDDELAEVSDRLETKRELRRELEQEGDDPSQTDIEAVLDEKLDALRAARNSLEDVEDDLTVERKSLESLREERASVAEQVESLSVPDEERLTLVTERIEDLRERKRSLEATISELQRVIGFNEEQLAESGDGLADALEDESDADGDGAVTDRLLDGERTVCWTCGSEVSRGEIDEMVERLRELRREKSAERNEVADELDELSAERSELETQRDEHERLRERLEELEADLERRERNVEELEERRAEQQERVAELEREVEELQEAQQDELLALQEEVSELGFERDRLAEERDDVVAEIEEIESELESREELAERRESIATELADLRTRIDRIEAEAIEGFNTHMEALLDQLGYGNIERIWIESSEHEVSDGRRRVTEERFDLHVVRQADAGPTYEDSIEHLSESERELVGLVVALAGYLVHDVRETAPFMLLDSLEMIDGERLVGLVDYLREYVPYLVVVLLPDHAAAFDGPDVPEHDRVTDI